MAALDLLPAAARADLSARTKLLCVLFFFSGFPALIYQLTWQRALFRVFGVNSESVTVVVSAFMLGLGLGSLAGGWISKRRSVSLLPLLAMIEVATAMFGIISLSAFEQVGAFIVDWPLPAVAAVNLLLVLIPTLLMGATLPILVSHLVRSSGQVGGSVGLLYYVNTTGAGAACLLCCVLLFPFLGMHRAVLVAVTLNVAVALSAIVIHVFHDDQTVPPDAAVIRPPSEAATRLPAAILLSALGGFISLSYEIYLFRIISYASGSSATTFALTLACFLFGVAAGARNAGKSCEGGPPSNIMRKAADEIIVANLFGLMFLPILSHSAFGRGTIGIALLLVYLIARCWGSLLPYLAQIGIPSDERAGMRTSLLYFANILGSTTGAILTGFVLTDYLSSAQLAVALIFAGTACVLILLAQSEGPRGERRKRTLRAIAVLALACVAIPQMSHRLFANLLARGQTTFDITDIVENRSGIITVDKDGTVYGNGMYDGRFNTRLAGDPNGIIRPYALSLFRGALPDVLMIGLSSGSWAQVIANNPAVRSLTIVEINPGYLRLIDRRPEVASVRQNSKVRIITDDGRRWLSHHPDQRFDAIVSNTTWNFRANTTNLLSAEFLELAKRHLNSGGVLFYNTTDSDRVQRTACLAFPYGARFTNHMIVSDRPIDWDLGRWRRTLESYVIDGEPQFRPESSEDRELLDAITSSDYAREVIEECPQLLVRTEGKMPVTDDNMGTEWRYPLGLD
ncbi:fused MFS/spermidine synthase [Bradyrhizobium jicamae]|uniref:Fused MFS/spermidine synthase n=1 Tax=Bradyrhizobium jicamae TaxID=280332 RepID=A0ABS5FWD8_9BRAD|nr:fused MFS/spermidine synthase [Bradyrhizobium jicamae]MBR0801105.1 fused MFS/spermidine synthase [Bradyrhizobium jicamae]